MLVLVGLMACVSVSIAEVLASGSSVQCFDNSTRGLDSSTALDFVKALRTLTDVSQKTTLATLYQAGEGIYQHFDKVILLDSGYEVYFGLISDAKPYFEGLGFVCDPRQTTAEFLTTVTDPSQRQARPGSAAASIKTSQDLAKAFQGSDAFSRLQSDLKELGGSYASQPELGATSPIKLSYPFQVWECLRREVQLINGRRAVYYQKWINTVVLCLIVGSEYFDISSDAAGAFTRQGVIFYAIIANAWMQYPELFDAHANRPVLERQSSVNMYRSSAVAVARILIDIPMIAVQHAWFMIAYYFLAHNTVAYTAGDFFYFYFVLCLSTINFANLLRMFACMSHSPFSVSTIPNAAHPSHFRLRPQRGRLLSVWRHCINDNSVLCGLPDSHQPDAPRLVMAALHQSSSLHIRSSAHQRAPSSGDSL